VHEKTFEAKKTEIENRTKELNNQIKKAVKEQVSIYHPINSAVTLV